MVILVTGGCGFIGSNFVRYLRERRPDDRVVVLDALTYAGNFVNLDGLDVVVEHVNICDNVAVQRVMGEWRPNTVVHFAAETHVDRSIAGPQEHIRTNVLGTAILLESAKEVGVNKFLHVSSDEVYGDLGDGEPAFAEDTPCSPRSPYAASKASSDHLVLAWFRTYGLPVVITRCSNNYGPRQHPEKLIPTVILRALANESIPVYGNGLNVRDWIHVNDHCMAIDAVLQRGEIGHVYNIGATCERTNIEVVRRILEICGRDESIIRYVADRPGHDRRYAVNTGKIRTLLGWSPKQSFEEGIAETVKWYLENESWWRPVLSGEYRMWIDKNYKTRGTK